MPTPRRSARVAAQDTSPDYTDPPESGRKRKSETTGSSPSAKRGKKAEKMEEKEQKTIEETLDVDMTDDPQPEAKESGDSAPTQSNAPPQPEHKPVDSDVKEPDPPAVPDAQPKTEPPAQVSAAEEPKPTSDPPPEPQSQPLAHRESEPKPQPQEATSHEVKKDSTTQPQDSKPQEPEKITAAVEHPQEEKNETPQVDHKQNDSQSAQSTFNTNSAASTSVQADAEPAPAQSNGDAVIPKARDDDVPSSILEKGVVYFFFRPRVNIDQPQDVQDIARSYFVLRPLPHGAKLGDGPIGDGNNSRLIALPKKVLPLSGKDRFMVFVEKAQSSFAVLKNDFMTASDYATKTAGTSHSPPVTPVAEGVYAITTTGRESHLAYMLTIPAQLGEVQKDVGLKESGSFVVSAKNPKFPGPANTNIGKDPGYPEDIKQEFRDLRWMPLKPKLLDYVGTQFLLIGESSGLEKATEQLPRDEKQDKDTPLEEIQKLEGEDEIRVKHLKGDDAVFADLGISKKEFPPVPTTW